MPVVPKFSIDILFSFYVPTCRVLITINRSTSEDLVTVTGPSVDLFLISRHST